MFEQTNQAPKQNNGNYRRNSGNNAPYPILSITNMENSFIRFIATKDISGNDISVKADGEPYVRLTFKIGRNNLNVPEGNGTAFYLNKEFAQMFRNGYAHITRGEMYEIRHFERYIFGFANLTNRDPNYTCVQVGPKGRPVAEHVKVELTPYEDLVLIENDRQAPQQQQAGGFAPPVSKQQPEPAPVPKKEFANEFEKDILGDPPISAPAAYKAAVFAYADGKDQIEINRAISAEIDTKICNALIKAKELFPSNEVAQSNVTRMILELEHSVNRRLQKDGAIPFQYIACTSFQEVEKKETEEAKIIKTTTTELS